MSSSIKFPPSPIDRTSSHSSIHHTERLNVLSTDPTLRNNLADDDPSVQFKAACKFSNQAHAVTSSKPGLVQANSSPFPLSLIFPPLPPPLFHPLLCPPSSSSPLPPAPHKINYYILFYLYFLTAVMPSKRGLVEAGIVPILVRYLEDPNILIQHEAISAITKIAAISREYAAVVVGENVVPTLLTFLESSNPDTRELAVSALGTIASGNPEARDLALSQNALPPLLQLIAHTTQHSSMLRTSAWALSSLCGGYPPPPFDQVIESLPTLGRLVRSVDEEVIACACWCFASLTHEEKVTPKFLELSARFLNTKR
eukprot:Phypoly_transcript_03965.p1 GENE.Phypoly_transcript_03965~~Phypoly_transcript_03965.p1  ORF type:complete len:313 (+),score=50.71 Phypoly_transcript_03965:190-1128(+)